MLHFLQPMGEFRLWRQAQQHLQISVFHRNLSFKIFYISHAVRHSLSAASRSAQCWACCWFSGSCTMDMTSSDALWAWGSHAPGDLGTTWASVREQTLPKLASNGNQTVLHCFTLVLRNENFCQLYLFWFPLHSQSYFSCKMNGNMLFFNKLCFTTWRIPSRSSGPDFGSDEAGFCFLVVMAPGCMHPWGATEVTGWFGKHLCPAEALSEWKNHIHWDCSYVRLFYMWDHWFISVCGLEVFCNHTSYWGFAVKTPQTEKGYVYWYSININLIFLINGEYFEGLFSSPAPPSN